jgi:hypothetical protein
LQVQTLQITQGHVWTLLLAAVLGAKMFNVSLCPQLQL